MATTIRERMLGLLKRRERELLSFVGNRAIV
jgi:hypothetical protein